MKPNNLDGDEMIVNLEYIVSVRPGKRYDISIITTAREDIVVKEPYDELVERILKKMMKYLN